MSTSRIEWTQSTWNPLTGCTKLSPGCTNCYAERMALRLQAMGSPNYSNGFKLTAHEHLLEVPLRWKKPRLIFVNSMSDLFHEDVPHNFVYKTFETMKKAHWHTFQILTKRSSVLSSMAKKLEWAPNIWMGVSVENQNYVYRINNLFRTDAFVKFVSFEPLLGKIVSFPTRLLDWVIVGGESGPGSRQMQKAWVNTIYERCKGNDIPFFFKQWGGTNKKKTGRIFNRKTWDEMPKAGNLFHPA